MKFMKQTHCSFLMGTKRLTLVPFNQFCAWLQWKRRWAHSACTSRGNYTQVLFNEMHIQFKRNSLFMSLDKQYSWYFRLAYTYCLALQYIYVEKSKLSCSVWCWRTCLYVALLGKLLPSQMY